MQAMRCAEEAYGLYYYFDSSRELLCYSLPWVFFQRSFSLSGSCSTGLLVAACGSCVSHLPRYIIDWHLLLSIRFSRIKEGMAATQLPGRLFSQRLQFAMQSEWECGKMYFRPCISHVIGASTDPLSSYLKTSCWTCSTRFENIRSRVNNFIQGRTIVPGSRTVCVLPR